MTDFKISDDLVLLGASTFGAAKDAQIHRGDGADIIEQRRGLNSQKWNIYDRFVSFSDYDRLGIYIGGGPPVIAAIIRPESTDGTQAITLLVESLSNASGDGALTLRGGTSGATLLLNTAANAAAGQFTGGGTFTFGEDLRVTGLIASVGVGEGTAGIGIEVDIAGQGAAAFEDSHSINLIGAGQLANRAEWKQFVDVTNIGANSIWTLQQQINGGGFSNRMTIDDSSDVVVTASALTLTGTAASFATLMPKASTPITGLLLDSEDLTSAGQRDSDAIILTGNAHDGATARSTRWKTFVDVTNNSSASTLRLQHSAAGGAFADFLLIDTTGELTLAPGSGRFSFGSAQSVSLLNDDGEVGELGQRSGTQAQVFNIYNTFSSSSINELAEIGWIPVSNTFVIGTKKGASGGTARPISIRTDEIEAIGIDISQNVTLAANLAVSGAGPHAIAGTPSGIIGLIISETFTSDGSGTLASGVFITQTLIGASGDTTSLTGTTFISAITTQTETEDITNISQVEINEPFISDNLTGNITNAQTLLIVNAPTEGVANYALRVASGDVLFADLQFSVGEGSIGDIFQVEFGGNFASGGSLTFATNFRLSAGLVGAAGDTGSLTNVRFEGGVTTQTATESIGEITQLRVAAPTITDNLTGGGLITTAQALLIPNAPTAGVNNYALRVITGATLLGGELEHTGSTLGFFGTSPTTQPASYTRNATIVEDRTLLASASATALNNNNVLAALIADLQSLGVIG